MPLTRASPGSGAFAGSTGSPSRRPNQLLNGMEPRTGPTSPPAKTMNDVAPRPASARANQERVHAGSLPGCVVLANVLVRTVDTSSTTLIGGSPADRWTAGPVSAKTVPPVVPLDVLGPVSAPGGRLEAYRGWPEEFMGIW